MSQGGSPRASLQLVSIAGGASLWTLSALKSGSGLLLLSLEPVEAYEVCLALVYFCYLSSPSRP